MLVSWKVFWTLAQIYKGDPRTCAIFIPPWGWNLNWGYSGFSRDQNNRNSSGAYVLRSKCENKHACRKDRTARQDRGRILFPCVSACVVGKHPNTPNLSPMADDVITVHGRYTRSEISFVYLRALVKSKP